MTWIRIDRYWALPPAKPSFEDEMLANAPEIAAADYLENPDFLIQPILCQHCENAPCEYVCPVGATQHTADGLNAMIYNRCVGTRYCSQNCPYKVRRFNWFQYTGAQATFNLPPAVHNPEVTLRAEGVMEKCTYCVQRIRRKTLDAELEDRQLADGELQTACQQTCPTQAIVFGDLNRRDSAVKRLSEHPLSYGLLENLNVRPRTRYLAAVTHPNPALASRGGPETTDGPGPDASVGHYTPPGDAQGGHRA